MAAGLILAVESGAAGIKVHVDFDKNFAFYDAHTWGWNPEGPGEVLMARTPDDDPAAAKKRNEPVILSAVSLAMPRTGLKPAIGTPDLTLTYYALLTIGTSAQTMGQFLPAVSDWGVPPFTPSTTSLEVMERGSLVLDLAAKGQVVWRGVGAAQIKMDLPQHRREALIRQAVNDILKKYPPRKK